MPFGGGNRRCLGATFALAEQRIVVREVLRRVELATTDAPGERQRVKAVILVPHRGARITVRSRYTLQASRNLSANSSGSRSPNSSDS